MRLNRKSSLSLGIGILLFLIPRALWAFEAEVVPKASDNFYEARTRLWLPKSANNLRAVLVFLGGTDSDARSMVDKAEWQDFAEKNRIALLGCHFRGEGEPYESAEKGSGQALLRMIGDLATQSGQAELDKLPLLFVGHSAGAMFSYNFTCWRPERVAAFISVKSGPIMAKAKKDAVMVPGLFIVGEKDLSSRVQTTVTAYLAGHDLPNCCWALALEGNGGHGSSPAIKALIRSYLSDVLALREGDSGRQFEPSEVRKSLPHSEQGQVWLPGAESAAQWQGFAPSSNLGNLAQNGGVQDTGRQSDRTSVNLGEWDLRELEKHSEITADIHLPGIDAVSCTSQRGITVKKFTKNSNGRYTLTIEVEKKDLFVGYFRFPLTLQTKAGKSVMLSAYAKITSGYRISPPSVYVGVIPRGHVAEIPVHILSETGKPQKILQIKSTRSSFASAQETSRGTLLCRFDGKTGLGNQSGHFELTCAENPEVRLRIPFIAWVSKKDAL